MKRPCEDSSSAGSDLEERVDVGREGGFPGHTRPALIRHGSPTTTPQIIEKRRRDRINSSLSELRRLVPTAFEKQGSAKLEKAEILQMTVDHLKLLHATGGKGYWDAHVLALDFLSLGFRECVTEVSRYLSAVEGLDAGDPLRTRLLSHLTSCTSQRDAAALTLTSHHLHHLHHPPSPSPLAFHPHPPPPQWALRPLPAAVFGLGTLAMSPDSGGGGGRPTPRLRSHTDSPSSSSSSSSSSPSSFLRAPTGGAVGPCTPASLSASLLSLSASVQAFPLAFPPLLPPAAFATPPPASSCSSVPPATSSSSSSSSRPPQSSSGKPYRPWGTEVGAF